jgi:hypothetical protein
MGFAITISHTIHAKGSSISADLCDRFQNDTVQDLPSVPRVTQILSQVPLLCNRLQTLVLLIFNPHHPYIRIHLFRNERKRMTWIVAGKGEPTSTVGKEL